MCNLAGLKFHLFSSLHFWQSFIKFQFFELSRKLINSEVEFLGLSVSLFSLNFKKSFKFLFLVLILLFEDFNFVVFKSDDLLKMSFGILEFLKLLTKSLVFVFFAVSVFCLLIGTSSKQVWVFILNFCDFVSFGSNFYHELLDFVLKVLFYLILIGLQKIDDFFLSKEHSFIILHLLVQLIDLVLMELLKQS